MGIVIIIILIGLFLFVGFKISKLRSRATQHMLGQVGLGSADINAKMNEKQEQHFMAKLLEENPSLNEQFIKDTLYAYSQDLINCRNNALFDQKVLEKMPTDNLLVQMRTMSFVRTNVLSYRNGVFYAIAIYTDQKDEYQISMSINIVNNQLMVLTYGTNKGIMRGF